MRLIVQEIHSSFHKYDYVKHKLRTDFIMQGFIKFYNANDLDHIHYQNRIILLTFTVSIIIFEFILDNTLLKGYGEVN